MMMTFMLFLMEIKRKSQFIFDEHSPSLYVTMYWSMQAESFRANMYVWDLPESDADLSDEISWAHLPGSSYRDPISIASKYAVQVRRTQPPMHILAYKVQRLHAVSDEVANPTTSTSI
jgi:hypothetical protein